MSEHQQSFDFSGKQLGQFQIGAEIGRGGMATVYRATQESVDRTVAIKILPPHFLHDPDFLERFKREVAVITRLEHPHILPIYDYGEHEGVPYIAMRYLGGGSMADMIERGVPPLESLERPIMQVAAALDYAHSNGVIHRDLKPANIILDEAGNAYLTDFGIAHVIGSNLTGSAILGTPSYMSPEQANALELDPRSDVYSLGIVLFELVTGQQPFTAPTPMAVMIKQITQPVPPVRSVSPDIPETIEWVINRATAKESEFRYESAGELADEFRKAIRSSHAKTDTGNWIQISTTAPSRPGGVRSSQTVRAVSDTTPTETLPEARLDMPITERDDDDRRRRPFPWLALVVVVMIILATIGLFTIEFGTETTTTRVVTLPTPFVSAETVSFNGVSLSLPSTWELIEELQDDGLTRRAWSDETASVYIAVMLVDDDIDDDEDFAEVVASFEEDYYESDDNFLPDMTFIDGAIAPDGSLRRSYRTDETIADAIELEPGQVDIFYLSRSGVLVVVEMYTADATENTHVERLQRILDSVRVDPSVL